MNRLSLCTAGLVAILVPAMVAFVVFAQDLPAVEERGEDAGALRTDVGDPGSSRPFGLEKRVAWTTSKVTGSPDPPSPYKVERVFEGLAFSGAVALANAPGSDRLFLAQVDGKIYSFANDPAVREADVFFDAATVEGFYRLYDVTFHPDFARNRYCYLAYVQREGNPDGTHISRFTVRDTNPPTIDLASEQIIITWYSGGHNGACIKFGPQDGCLYISTGDGSGPFPSDVRDTGQDIGDLLASILRIDVDHPAAGMQYSIPADNPFVDVPGARGEVWSYGHRNPWKMSFDPVTADLWVGDVGWEMWEMIYRIERGGNYGWSIQEHEQPVNPERKRGPTPILPPTIAHSHTESRSITGGFVYHGSRLPQLAGSYVYGDYVTGKIWGAKLEGSNISAVAELVDTSLPIVCFGVDNAGELYIIEHLNDGGLYRLVANPAATANADFPKKLSETGLYTSVADRRVAPGVVPYSINAEPWADHTLAERYVALPHGSQLGLWDATNVQVGYIKGDWKFPTDGLLVKTISIEMERGNPASRRNLETQVLHFNVDTWNAYSYLWNDEQSDAVLSDGTGADRSFTIADASAPGGRVQQTYHFASRTECLLCHSTRGGTVYGFKPEQLNRGHDYGGVVDNQLRTLTHIGLFETPPDAAAIRPMPDPHDPSADIEQRARAYLHVNCAHCHRRGGGGTAHMDVQYHFTLAQTNLLSAPRPTQGTFGIFQAQVFAPGDPFRSVLYYRMAKLGRGRMPHFGSSVVDERGLGLMFQWMQHSQAKVAEAAGAGKRGQRTEGKGQGAEESGTGGRSVAADGPEEHPTTETIVGRQRERELAALAKLILTTPHSPLATPSHSPLLDELLSSTSGALVLLRALDTAALPNSVREAAIASGSTHADVRIRDLFERFIPEENRVQRLGNVVKPEEILALEGDAARGSELFFNAPGVQCRNCHKIRERGKEVGPDLSEVGKKNDRGQLLESILEPSKKIDPKYVAWLAETVEGKVHTGLLIGRSEAEVVLRDATNKEIRIPTADIETLAVQPKSLMPELLLRDMTAQEVADLLEFLGGLKGK